MHAESFFKRPTTIENTPLPETSGYDIHYALPDDEKAEDARHLQELVEQYIKDYQANHPHEPIYVTKGKLTDKPVGPWQKRMWELEISTANKDTQPYDSEIVDPTKIRDMHQCMLSIGYYAKKEIDRLHLKGALIIHANNWPSASNMVLERSMHYENSWHVCGPKVIFNDIWKTLIAMEEYLKNQIMQSEKNWYNNASSLELIKLNFRKEFKDNTDYPYENGELIRAMNFLIAGQRNLAIMQELNQEEQNHFDNQNFCYP